jgi:hypothetical protein
MASFQIIHEQLSRKEYRLGRCFYPRFFKLLGKILFFQAF